ncbi:transporter, major facilitator family protein [Necator americanus]|uniref:Transporter, major facilitator family protein n=1 Tax=Necator americanus TaxID=51031 RepID=W2STN9_NECAM|nr:transporter, major facilitator family protein [Necator americanus]ETN72067.1 transporter, major facilitator family protein [Necator americanus]
MKVSMKSGDVSIRVSSSASICPSASPNLRLALVVLSIGVASHFMLFLDSVMDNLLPAAKPFLLTVYKNKEDADIAWEIMVSSRIYGLAFGCFASIFLSRQRGRKFPVVLGSVLDLVGILLTLVTVHVRLGMVAATIGRFINGCGQGIVQTAGSVMLAELPPTQKRGIALATLTVWACLGELAGMVISLEEFLGKPSTWYLAMGVPLIPLVPALFILARAPESLRYFFLENREDESRKALLFYQKGKGIDENGNRKKSDETAKIDDDKSTLTFAKDRFKNGQFIRPLLLALFVQSFVHLDDWLWISYSTHIFGKFGMTMGNAQRASLFMSLPQAFISIGLLACFENFTRRSLLLVPTMFSVVIGMCAIISVNFGRGTRDFRIKKIYEERKKYFSLLADFPIAATLVILAAMDLSAAAISGESAYAIVPELFLPNDKILGTAIVGIVQVCLLWQIFLHVLCITLSSLQQLLKTSLKRGK